MKAIRNSLGDVCNRIFANRQVFGDNAVQYHAHFVERTVLKPILGDPRRNWFGSSSTFRWLCGSNNPAR